MQGLSLHASARVVTVALALWAGVLSACDKSNAAQRAAPKVQSYDVLTVTPSEVTLYIEVPATVTGKQNVEIRPMVDGYIEKVFVDEGAWVKAGQPLFQIRAPQYEQEVRTAQAGIKTAEAAVGTARMTVDKLRPLVEKQIISEYTLQESQFALEQRQAELAQARAALANANTNLGYTTVKSPAGGVIGRLPFKIGALVTKTSSEPLTTVSDISEVYAYFSVNEKVILALTRDVEGVTFQEKLAKMPDVAFVMADGILHEHTGKVQAASGLIDPNTGSTNFRATFANPRGLLRSGASGLVRIMRPVADALTVPQAATYELQGKHFLYVVAPDDTVHATEVSVRATPDGKRYVVDSGLEAGQRVLLDGLASLQEGAKIDPKPAKVDPDANAE